MSDGVLSMKLLLQLVFCCVLIACSNPASRSSLSAERKSVAEDAIRAQIACGKEHVAETDDGTSDASTVALALALRCNREYGAATEAWGAAYLDNEAQRRMFRQRRSGSSERMEAFLPIVMQYRQASSSPKTR